MNETIGKIIDISEIPKSHLMQRSKFRELCKSVPEGKALVVQENEANLNSLYSFVRYAQGRGQFRNYRCIRRKVEGKRVAYLIHLEGKTDE